MVENFSEMWDIYESSFPEDEKRSLKRQLELLKNPNYQMKSLKDDNKVVGFICFWDIGEYVFIEHFAIDDKYRGRNYGSKFLNAFIGEANKKIVLEVEMPEDILAKRRIKFYQRLDFKLNDYDYTQPPLEEGKNSIPLLLMTYPEAMDQEQFNQVKEALYGVVYSN
ncbi:GNAT family N-acetyltransferase [Facklamia sp. 7083-14-GEN3]|uniref:GNAT family N-acetyltransferase n=1 Tax=Facklamia sp. 7083-14-GEN3 TaxID=2973478 RepID=UPI00215BB24F|nr:GNAT family N-acetyltransferase [Facklamia sp. 7083-14-GEN3]MCR8969084.1 GNAT family N-acetyltransferase [Facklamia sp. 7083-14-GEN3]